MTAQDTYRYQRQHMAQCLISANNILFGDGNYDDYVLAVDYGLISNHNNDVIATPYYFETIAYIDYMG